MLLSRHLVKITNNTADNHERAEKEPKNNSKGPAENCTIRKTLNKNGVLEKQNKKYQVMSSFGLKPLASSTTLLEK